MQSPFNLFIFIAAVSGLWIFWDKALRSLLLDAFRERIFELRFSLFELGMKDDVNFESEVYRQLETLLSGLLRWAHNVTFLTFVISRAEQEKAKQQKDYVDVSQQIELKIRQLNPEVQDEMNRILTETRKAILLYISFTSLFFLGCSALLTTLRLVGIWHPEKADEISNVVEQEAYKAEIKRLPPKLAHA